MLVINLLNNFKSMKKNIINIIISILLLIIAASLILFINKITTPIILESDLLEQCREAGGEYNAYQFDKDDEITIYCEIPNKELFNIKVK